MLEVKVNFRECWMMDMKKNQLEIKGLVLLNFSILGKNSSWQEEVFPMYWDVN